MLKDLYKQSLGLLTDLYQLTMAHGYWKSGRADQQAVFCLNFRQAPFDGGYAVACGLGDAIEYLQGLSFSPEDLAYLASLTGGDDQPLFDRGFMDFLGKWEFAVDVDAVPEGTVVFPHEPLLRVSGPIWQGQLIETALLTILNFQTLIATKSARICQSAGNDPVIEFGLRRAQGIDGGLSASRAAYVGGAAGTSNVLAGRLLGIPVKGTHAHSWVMSFDDELSAFETYAQVMPNNCVFLVDTYNTLEGVRHAAKVGLELKKAGHRLLGIRLDSGDLAYLSIEARRILDEAGLADASIMASNDLDEHIIQNLKLQGATIGVWGVGTRLVTAYDQPALGGVYKLTAIRDSVDDTWRPRIKLSEQAAKVTNPGLLQVRRFMQGGQFVGDAIYDQAMGLPEVCTIVDPTDMTRRKVVGADVPGEDLLVPIFRAGRCVYDQPSLVDIRQRVAGQLSHLHSGVRRFVNPHQYPAGLELGLHDYKTELILQARGLSGGDK